jgi:hypothetical protein
VLRRNPANGHTVRPRLDRLTVDQHNAITRAGRRTVLTEDEASQLFSPAELSRCGSAQGRTANSVPRAGCLATRVNSRVSCGSALLSSGLVLTPMTWASRYTYAATAEAR